MLAQLGILLAEGGAAAEAGGHSETPDPPNPVLPEMFEVVWAAIFFLALLALMRYVLLPQIKRLIDEREAKVRGDLAAAEMSKDELTATRAAYDAALADARNEANGLIDAARGEADSRRSEIFAAAEAEIASLRAAAQEEINEARARALTGLRSDVVELSVGAASKVLGKPLDKAAHQATVERVLGRK